jgi:hypothetical protein
MLIYDSCIILYIYCCKYVLMPVATHGHVPSKFRKIGASTLSRRLGHEGTSPGYVLSFLADLKLPLDQSIKAMSTFKIFSTNYISS